MNVSVETLHQWMNENNFHPANGESLDDAAAKLLNYLRQVDSNHGDDKARDTRNIHDFLKSLSHDEIREDIEQTRSGMVNIFLNVAGDFNLSTGIRNAVWYNTAAVWIVGRRKWDRRGAVGSHHYIDVHRDPSMENVINTLRADGYTIIAAEITDTAVPLTGYQWDEKTAVIYGEESAGVPQEILDMVDDVVYIPSRGPIRSLNVGNTSGIFIHDYHAKLGLIDS